MSPGGNAFTSARLLCDCVATDFLVKHVGIMVLARVPGAGYHSVCDVLTMLCVQLDQQGENKRNRRHFTHPLSQAHPSMS